MHQRPRQRSPIGSAGLRRDVWAWSPASAPAAERASGIAFMEPQIRIAVASVPAEKGLRPTRTDAADAWLDYAINLQRIARPDGTGSFDVETHGTLMIEMRGVKTGRIGWLGTATGIPKETETLPERRATATRVTRRLLDHFPDR
jgi:hypothetical protein